MYDILTINVIILWAHSDLHNFPSLPVSSRMARKCSFFFDFSILLEWEGFAVDGLKDGHLNLGFDLALQALNLDALKSEDVEKLVVSTENDSSLMTSMLPVQAEPYFRSHLLRPKNASLEFAPGFSILLATQGNGQINTEKQGNFAIDKGDAYIIPFESGSWSLTGNIEVLLSRPPAPDAPMSSL